MIHISDTILPLFKTDEPIRILAYGASATERTHCSIHWFDCLDIALRHTYGRHHHSINTGISGNTTRDLLLRFNRDAAFYKPHITLITVGANDANPQKNISSADYEKNCLELLTLFTKINCRVIFQTYYAPDSSLVDPIMLKNFYYNMGILRKIAKNGNCAIIDHFAYWEPFRKKFPDTYTRLMKDCFHVNALGNLVLGLFISRQFSAEIPSDETELTALAKDILQSLVFINNRN